MRAQFDLSQKRALVTGGRVGDRVRNRYGIPAMWRTRGHQ